MSIENHATFEQRNLFVCPKCNDVFAGRVQNTTCRRCKTMVSAQSMDCLGGHPSLHGLYCCRTCGHHESYRNAISWCDIIRECTNCHEQSFLHIIAPVAIARAWNHNASPCEAHFRAESDARIFRSEKTAAKIRYCDTSHEHMMQELADERMCLGKSFQKPGLLAYVAERLNVDETQVDSMIEAAVCLRKELREQRMRDERAARVKVEMDFARNKYGDKTDDEIFRSIGHDQMTRGTFVGVDEGTMAYLCERLKQSNAEIDRLIHHHVELAKERAEARRFDDTRNSSACDFCGKLEHNALIATTECLSRGKDRHDAVWCLACQTKENRFFMHQKTRAHPDTKTCKDCGHISFYGCIDCRGESTNIEFLDMSKSTHNKPVWGAHKETASSVGENAKTKCGFCTSFTNDIMPMKKRCARHKTAHACCSKCLGKASCS